MENEKVFIATDRETLAMVISEAFKKALQLKKGEETSDFEKDRLTKRQAAKLAGISIPTLDKQIKLGKFKQYSLGSRRYFMKSEIIESLRSIS